MKVSLSRMHALAIALVPLVLLVFNHGTAAAANRALIIDIHGRQIASIFSGVSPNPRYAVAFSQMMKTGGTSQASCTLVRKAIFRESDHVGRFLKVQGGCGAHYQVEEIRQCGSCLG